MAILTTASKLSFGIPFPLLIEEPLPPLLLLLLEAMAPSTITSLRGVRNFVVAVDAVVVVQMLKKVKYGFFRCLTIFHKDLAE